MFADLLALLALSGLASPLAPKTPTQGDAVVPPPSLQKRVCVVRRTALVA